MPSFALNARPRAGYGDSIPALPSSSSPTAVPPISTQVPSTQTVINARIPSIHYEYDHRSIMPTAVNAQSVAHVSTHFDTVMNDMLNVPDDERTLALLEPDREVVEAVPPHHTPTPAGAVPSLASAMQLDFDSLLASVPPEQKEYALEQIARSNRLRSSALDSRTLKGYESAVKSFVPKVQKRLAITILPLDTVEKCILFFATFTSEQSYAPKSWITRPGDQEGAMAIRWSTITYLKAALLFYHRANNWHTELDSKSTVWIDFMRGLKREAVHLVKPKTAVEYKCIGIIMILSVVVTGLQLSPRLAS